jgi:GLPGLI family protein
LFILFVIYLNKICFMSPVIRILGLILLFAIAPSKTQAQQIEGRAFYFAKSKMELGNWGARMSEAEKKQVQARLKNRLEKTYILSFNKQESLFIEEEKLDAISGATDSWGSNFSRGHQYKNIKDTTLVQAQEFYGKKFLVKDKLQKFDWVMSSESKQIGNYLCFKAIATVPTSELVWFDFSWGDLQAPSSEAQGTIPMTAVEAWYTLQIPIGHGPAEYWGLPGFILEVSAGNTTILCSEIILNPKEKVKIEAPDKGEITQITPYRSTVQTKMMEMRNSFSGRRN